jgi:hypothetical protein
MADGKDAVEGANGGYLASFCLTWLCLIPQNDLFDLRREM